MATVGPVRRCASGAALSFRLDEGLPNDRAEWERLAELSGNIFATPEWLLGWWERFGDDRPVFTVTAADDDGALRALALVYVQTRGPVRIVRFVGHGPGDELGPICDPSDRSRSLAGVMHLVHEHDLCDLFVGQQLPGWVELPAEAGGDCLVLERGGSPLIRFDGEEWESFLAARSAGLRRDVRKLGRRLIGSGRASLRRCDDPERLQADLDAFFALHRERFGGRSGFLTAPAAEAFHRAFAEAAFAHDRLLLWLLESDGRPQAAWYGFRFAGSDSFYQSGRAVNAHSGCGILLLAVTVRQAIEDGSDEYRFLRGSEAYKYRWANEDPGLQTIATAGTRLGRLVLGTASVAPQLTGPWLLRG